MYENSGNSTTKRPLARRLCHVRVRPQKDGHEDGGAIGSFVCIPQALADQVLKGKCNYRGKQFPVTLHLTLSSLNHNEENGFSVGESVEPVETEITATWNGLAHKAEDVEVSYSLYRAAIKKLLQNGGIFPNSDIDVTSMSSTISLSTISIWDCDNCLIGSRIVATVANKETYNKIQACRDLMCQIFLRRVSHARVGDVVCLDMGMSLENDYFTMDIQEIQTQDGTTYKAYQIQKPIFKFVRDSEMEIEVRDGETSQRERKPDVNSLSSNTNIMRGEMRTFGPPWVLPLGSRSSFAVELQQEMSQERMEAIFAAVHSQDGGLRDHHDTFKSILDRSQLTSVNNICFLSSCCCVDCIFISPEDYYAICRGATASDTPLLQATIDLASMVLWVGRGHSSVSSAFVAPCIITPSDYVDSGNFLPSSACLLRFALFYGFSPRKPAVHVVVRSSQKVERSTTADVRNASLNLRPIRYAMAGKMAVQLRASPEREHEDKYYNASENTLKKAHEVIKSSLNATDTTLQTLCWQGSFLRVHLSHSFVDFAVCNDCMYSPMQLAPEAQVNFGNYLDIDLLRGSLKDSSLIYWNDWPFTDTNILRRTHSHVWDGPWEQKPGNTLIRFNNETISSNDLSLGLVCPTFHPKSITKTFRHYCQSLKRGCSLGIFGGPGLGKTSFLASLLRRCILELPGLSSSYVLDGQELASLEFSRAYEILTTLHKELAGNEMGCSLLVIDNAQCIGRRAHSQGNTAQHDLLLKCILKTLFSLCYSKRMLLVIASTNDARSWYPLLDLFLSLPGPNEPAARDFVCSVNASLCSRTLLNCLLRHQICSNLKIQWATFKKNHPASNWKALRNSLCRLVQESGDIYNGSLERLIRESANHSSMESPVLQRWANLGVVGMERIKEILLEQVILPLRWRNLYLMESEKLSGGLLLYGPPGCGKTKIAEALAAVAGVNIKKLKGPELLSKYIGASEKNVRKIFTEAAENAPCILLFDEFDSIATPRGCQQTTGVNDRIVNQLLTMLDGFDSSTNACTTYDQNVSRLHQLPGTSIDYGHRRYSGVFVLATTSRIDLIDNALLRAGRIDQHIFCPPPSVREKVMLLRNLLASAYIEAEALEVLEHFASKSCATFADIQGLATTTITYASYTCEEGYTGGSMHVSRADASNAIKDCGSPSSKQITAHSHSKPARARVALD